MRERVDILGVLVDAVTADGALAQISRFVRQGGAHQIVTVNPEFVMRAQWDEAFREVLNGAGLALADGIGLVWASRLLGHPLPERVAGSDLVPRIAQSAVWQDWRLYLLGAGPGVARQAARALTVGRPGLQVVGTYAGSPDPEMDEAIVRRVRAARPDVLLVAYGAPAQDMWIARNLPGLGVPVAMGVGGSLDFIAGQTRRAPRWVQSLGLEWLHRLILEPWRWRRMLALPRFAWQVVQTVIGRTERNREFAPTSTDDDDLPPDGASDPDG
jgi:N-acetylglucosaminyldiphosphoundecaprenol N-acetyl-beta-D-mannosaminyltransferase